MVDKSSRWVESERNRGKLRKNANKFRNLKKGLIKVKGGKENKVWELGV